MASKKKNKKSKLSDAASRRLQTIGGPKLSPQELAHMLFHAEQSGEVERVPQDDGTFVYLLPPDKTGVRQSLKPTPEMVAAIDAYHASGHTAH